MELGLGIWVGITTFLGLLWVVKVSWADKEPITPITIQLKPSKVSKVDAQRSMAPLLVQKPATPRCPAGLPQYMNPAQTIIYFDPTYPNWGIYKALYEKHYPKAIYIPFNEVGGY